jgi:hypothetical protein
MFRNVPKRSDSQPCGTGRCVRSLMVAHAPHGVAEALHAYVW